MFDKATERVFQTSVDNVAAITSFYELPSLAREGADPNELERQFSRMESDAAGALARLLDQVETNGRIDLPQDSRWALAWFIVLQMLRTHEAREMIVQLFKKLRSIDPTGPSPLNALDDRELHAEFLWNQDHVYPLVELVQRSIWIVGRNRCGTPFLTSDHPANVKSGDNRGFVLHPFIVSQFVALLQGEPPSLSEDYIVFPVTPHCVLYCYGREQYARLAAFDNTVSPVAFTPEMVNHENSGQVGMSRRFVYSPSGDFSFARAFVGDQPWVRDSARDRFEERHDPFR